MAISKVQGRKRRKRRIRKTIFGSSDRPRLSVFRSARHIYAQVIDDAQGVTLASASTLCKELGEPAPSAAPAPDEKKGRAPTIGKTAAARGVGALLAKRCKDKNVRQVVFDRNGYLYHGRVRALAEAAREAGLDF